MTTKQLQNTSGRSTSARAKRRLWSATILAAAAATALSAHAAPVTGTWATDGDADWLDSSNWLNGGVPGVSGLPGDVANLTLPLSAERTVALNGTATLGTLNFDGPFGYTIGGSGPLTFAPAASGTAAINVAGTAAHVLALPLQFSGPLNVAVATGASLEFDGPFATSTASLPNVNFTGGGTLRFAQPPGTPATRATINVSSGTLDVRATAVLTAPTGALHFGTGGGGGGTLRLGDGVQVGQPIAFTNGMSIDVPVGVAQFSSNTNPSTLFWDGDTLTKTGAGTLALSVDSWTRPTNFTLSRGELLVDIGAIFAPVNMTMAGGTTFAARFGSSFDFPISVTGDVQLGDAARPGATTIFGAFTLGTNQSNYAVTVPAGVHVSLNQLRETVAGTGMSFGGGGTVTLNSPLSKYTGPTSAIGGVLDIHEPLSGSLTVGSDAPCAPIATARASLTQVLPATHDVTINASGTLDVAPTQFQLVGSLNGAGTVAFTNVATSAFEALQIQGTADSNFSGALTGFGGIRKYGAATALTLSGNSTLDGGIIGTVELHEGALRLGSDGALGHGFLDVNDTTGSTTVSAINGPRSFTNGVWVESFAAFTGSNAMSFGTLTVNGNAQLDVEVDTAFAGLASNAGSRFTKIGPATLTLTPNASFVGTSFYGSATISAGTLRLLNPANATNNFTTLLLNNAALDISAATAAVNLPAIVSTGGTIRGSINVLSHPVAGTNLTIAGDVTVGNPITDLLTGTVTMGNVTVLPAAFPSSSLTFHVPTKSAFGGTGTVTLTPGAHLTVDGTLAKPVVGTGAVTVAGAGTITGPVSLTGVGTNVATFQPGGFLASSALRTGSLTLGDDTRFASSLSGTNALSAIVTGSVDLGGGVAALALSTSTNLATVPLGTTYLLLNNDGTDPITGRFATLPDDGDTLLVHGFKFDYTFAVDYHYDAAGDGGGDNDLAVTLLAATATPEPTAATTLAGVAMLLASRRHRRRRQHAD